MTRGTIEERDGRFRGKVSIAGRVVRCGTHATREAAQAAINATLAVAAEEGITPIPTFGAYAETWLERRELGRKVRGIVEERSVVRSHILGSSLAGLALDEITPRDFRRWVEDLAGKRARRAKRKGADGVTVAAIGRPVSRQTVRHAVRVARGIFARAVREELIAHSPADVDVRDELPTAATDRSGWTFLTVEEIAAVTTSPKLTLADRLLYTVAIYTGLRAGELWGLRWGDVVLEGPRPMLRVCRNREAPTKGGKPREVPLSPTALAALVTLHAGVQRDSDALVWPSSSGGCRRKGDDNGWRDRPQRYAGRVVVHPGHKTRAGVTRPVRFHDLRHTCASHLISGTWGRAWTIEEVAAFLGHESVATTKRYAHLAPDALHAAAAATRGTAPPVPADGSAQDVAAQVLKIVGRAMQESNLRPTAPEARGNASNGAGFGRDGTAEGQARDYLTRVAAGEPVTVLDGVRLAEAMLDDAATRRSAPPERATMEA